MTRTGKLFDKIRANPHNVRFSDLLVVVDAVGFEWVATRGSHHRYTHREHREACLNLQPRGGMAKTYQVRQFLTLVERYNLKP